MKVTLLKDENTLRLCLSGRLDSESSTQVQSQLDDLLQGVAADSQLVLDASELSYISSSGLRILLKLLKQYPRFCMTEVCSDVYQVLEMTGFTKMMHVERALRRLSVDGCEEIGRGGVGVVYRISDDSIIKVFREGSSIEEVQREITMSKEAFVLGMPTAISFDVVKVGNQYGLVYELLRAETLSTCISRQPERIDDWARHYAGLFTQLHAIHVPQGGVIPRVMDRVKSSIHHIQRYFDTASTDFLLRIAEAIPHEDRLLHCDLQTKNAMMQDGELMLIDMGEVGYGHPLIDLAHAYSAMVSLVGDYEQLIGMPRAVGYDLWQRTMRYYFAGLDEADFAHRMAQIEVASVVRNFTWLSLSDSFPPAVIKECQDVFEERVRRRKDYLLEVSSTFKDWTLK